MPEQPPAIANYCWNCGASTYPDATYCHYCGHLLSRTEVHRDEIERRGKETDLEARLEVLESNLESKLESNISQMTQTPH